ncbi:hypothetical protein [Hymenobacter terrestris]|uniref:Uncharacterized protein n=1 Tax=Hymenobacter terrestris TaxID=2748310 RepID=A0ABX2PYY7_9BACT|nr:hypothetical protein [Hymenobacter terrestris]NVO83900.1 hypothetical protein [Hymenobacter terrestris]
MLRSTLLATMLTWTLLAGCQSARFAPTFPRGSEYSVARSQPVEVPPLPVKPANEPVLSAALPGPELGKADIQQLAVSELVVSKPLSGQVAPVIAVPDTTLKRLLRPEPKLRADPLTTVINVAGAAAVVGGAGFAIAGAINNSSGYYPLAQVIAGIALLAVGIPLLFLQGKNGRRRLLREERKRNAAPVGAPAPKTDAANEPLQKLGLGMGIVAGVMLLLGALAGGFSFALALIIGLPLVIVGLLLFVVGS